MRKKNNKKENHNSKKTYEESPSTLTLENKDQIELLVPLYFTRNRMLGNDVNYKWNNPDTWVKHYQETLEILKKSFYDSDRDGYPENILKSLHSPCNGSGNIIWRFNESTRPADKKRERDEPFSIVCHTNGDGDIISNVIYDHKGNVRFMVDFAEHSSRDVHWHVLEPGNFDRSTGKNSHAHDWKICPWIWLAIPKEFKKKPALNAGKENNENISIKYSNANKRSTKATHTSTNSFFNDLLSAILGVIVLFLIFLSKPFQPRTIYRKKQEISPTPVDGSYAKTIQSLDLNVLEDLDDDLEKIDKTSQNQSVVITSPTNTTISESKNEKKGLQSAVTTEYANYYSRFANKSESAVLSEKEQANETEIGETTSNEKSYDEMDAEIENNKPSNCEKSSGSEEEADINDEGMAKTFNKKRSK